jgi:hypothetical protein
MDNKKEVHGVIGLDSRGAAIYFTARIKQLHTALELQRTKSNREKVGIRTATK